jgi:hypothetical protein
LCRIYGSHNNKHTNILHFVSMKVREGGAGETVGFPALKLIENETKIQGRHRIYEQYDEQYAI